MEWKSHIYFCLLINITLLSIVSSFSLSDITGSIYNGILNIYCNFNECCTKEEVKMDVNALRAMAKQDLFGQPLVEEAFHAFSDYWSNSKRSTKPLTISFNGWSGVGKTYFSKMIIRSFYKNDVNSKFVKRYNGHSSFPDPTPMNTFFYKSELRREVERTIRKCPYSLFVFEEVNDMPPDVLDAIKPFLDYHPTITDVDFSKAIFIFISNTGGDEIMEQFLLLKKLREDLKFSDFDYILRNSSYTRGGLKDAAIVENHLIDHYVPFLPLEENHIRLCIKREFKLWNIFDPTESMIQEAMSVLTFGPPELPIFSNSGCKRLEKKVAHIVMKSLREL